MYCNQCGSQNSDEAVFCMKCGAKIGLPQSLPTPPAFGFNPTPKAETRNKIDQQAFILQSSVDEIGKFDLGYLIIANNDIANSRSDVHFITFGSLVILRSGRRNSYQLLLLT